MLIRYLLSVSIFFGNEFPTSWKVLPMLYQNFLAVKVSTCGVLSNWAPINSFVMCYSFFCSHQIPQIHLMEKWWNAQRLCQFLQRGSRIQHPIRVCWGGWLGRPSILLVFWHLGNWRNVLACPSRPKLYWFGLLSWHLKSVEIMDPQYLKDWMKWMLFSPLLRGECWVDWFCHFLLYLYWPGGKGMALVLDFWLSGVLHAFGGKNGWGGCVLPVRLHQSLAM